jgi:hypothetical protein
MHDKSFTFRVPKTWVRTALIVAVTALIVAPLTAVATHTFDDVPNTHTFHAEIAWLEASGVTKGCNPPTNNLYCPNDFVTRGQMAAFMERFAGYLDAKDGTPSRAKGVSQVQRVTNKTAPADLTDGSSRTVSATCPEGFVATGGGGLSSHLQILLEDSYPESDGTAWRVRYTNIRGSTATAFVATVFVICIQADESISAVVSTQGLNTVGDKLD